MRKKSFSGWSALIFQVMTRCYARILQNVLENGTTVVLISHFAHFWSPVAYVVAFIQGPFGRSLSRKADSLIYNVQNFNNDLSPFTGSDLPLSGPAKRL